MFENLYSPANWSDSAAVELKHVDSQFCWCEPLVEVDEDGDDVVVHRHVTWN